MTTSNISPEIEEAYEAGRRAGYAEAASLKQPICGAAEPAFGVPCAYRTKDNLFLTNNPNSGMCTKPAGHGGDHGFDRQEGPFYVQHAWPQPQDGRTGE